MIFAYLYLILPGIVANAVPASLHRWNFLNTPIDAKKTYRGKRILGNNKTWRGLIFGTLTGTLTIQVQPYFLEHLHIINYNNYNLWLLGFCISFGVLFGDMIGSFIKRQANIKPGKPCFPLDQLDALGGALLLLWPFGFLTLKMVLTLIIFVLITHIVIRHAGYYLNIVGEKW